MHPESITHNTARFLIPKKVLGKNPRIPVHMLMRTQSVFINTIHRTKMVTLVVYYPLHHFKDGANLIWYLINFVEIYPTAAEIDDLMQFEEDCLAALLRKQDDESSSSQEERMRVMLERFSSILH